MTFKKYKNKLHFQNWIIVVLSLIMITILSPMKAKILWDGDASKGTSIFKVVGSNLESGSTLTVVNDSLYGKVWKFYKPKDSNRAEVHAAKGFDAKEGDVIFLGWRFKIDMPAYAGTNAVFQWKSYPAGQQNYPVVLKHRNRKLTILYHNPDYKDEYPWETPTVVNEWIEIVIKLKVSRDPKVGYIEFWYNGEHQLLSNGAYQYPARTLDDGANDPKWGVYGGKSYAMTNYVDALIIATTYEEAAPTKTTSVEEFSSIESPVLFHAYPNPFNSEVRFRYQLPEAGPVRLSIYNIVGEQITTLVDEYQEANHYQVSWSTNSIQFGSGIYFAKIQADHYSKTIRLILLK